MKFLQDLNELKGLTITGVSEYDDLIAIKAGDCMAIIDFMTGNQRPLCHGDDLTSLERQMLGVHESDDQQEHRDG